MIFDHRHKLTLIWLFAAALLLSFASRCAADQVITYPRPESAADQRASYPVALLQLCESKSNSTFSLRPSSFRSQQGRSLRQLSQGDGIDIVWAITTREREDNLLPVRIPIDKGMIGWRLLLVRSEDKTLFSQVRTAVDLGKLLAVQGHDWPDVEVLAANRMRVTTGATYEGLFKMLTFGHAQYFPRAVTEIWPELDSHSDLPLEVEPSLVIHYPSALYFFVNKKNHQLANTLETCLKQSIKDGSFDSLFERYYGEAIARAQLPRRNIIKLTNPTLPEATPLKNPDYWYTTGSKL
jgi:hypothetical protein